jgi:hypothetical protein
MCEVQAILYIIEGHNPLKVDNRVHKEKSTCFTCASLHFISYFFHLMSVTVEVLRV